MLREKRIAALIPRAPGGDGAVWPIPCRAQLPRCRHPGIRSVGPAGICSAGRLIPAPSTNSSGVFYLVEFMGLSGDEHRSRSCRGVMRGALLGGTPGTAGRGLPWDTRGGGWQGGVAMPLMAPAVTAAGAGTDSGCFRCEAPGSCTFSWAGPSRLEILNQKMIRKGQSAAPGTQHHLVCLHPEGKPFSRRRGTQGAGHVPTGSGCLVKAAVPILLPPFTVPSPFLWLWGQQNPGGMGTGGPSALTHHKHIP